MRRRRLTSQFVVVLVVIILICIGSAIYSRVSGNPSPVTKVVGMVTAPVQKIGNGIGNFFSKGKTYFLETDELLAENKELKQKISDMEQTVRDAELALDENARLREQLGMAQRDRTLTLQSAEVIARSPGEWAVVLTLDKGTSSGIKEYDVVQTEAGMVGYVSSVASNYCEVTTVIDLEMQCGALITRTREAAIAEGNYNLMSEGYLRLSYLQENSDVVIGDTIETSGSGGVFPKGIMIGTVEEVRSEENGISNYAVIRPFVDVETVTNVSVITDFSITE